MICLSTIKELRIDFISWFREHIGAQLPGIDRFLSGGRLLANVNPLFVPTANNFLHPLR